MLPALSTSGRCNDSDESNIEAKSHVYLIAGSRISKRRRSPRNLGPACRKARESLSLSPQCYLLYDSLWFCPTKEKATEQHYLGTRWGLTGFGRWLVWENLIFSRVYHVIKNVTLWRHQSLKPSSAVTAEGKSVVRTDYSELAPIVMADVLYAACENYVSQVALFMVLETHAVSPYRALWTWPEQLRGSFGPLYYVTE